MLNLLFMKIFSGIILACFIFEVQYAVRHRKGGAGTVTQRFTALIFGITGVAFVFLGIAHIVLLFLNVYPDIWFIFSTPVDLVLQIIGIILICTSMFFGLWGVLSLGELTADIRLAEEHRVVKTGAYYWVRHPLYSAIIFCCAGGLLFFKSFLFLILVVLVPAIYFEAKREEKLLIEASGEEYESYRATTGMFFPKVFPGKNINF
jgi:Putative protein-S-isoprenylcysteine methyltransferase